MTPKTASRLLSGLRACGLGFSLLLSGCTTTYHPYRVVSESMLPLLHPGDRIFVDESDQARSDLHDGDIIALRRNDAIVLKRIMAMQGETISGDHHKVFRNGNQLDEPYLAPSTGDKPPALITFSPRVVSSGELFVMGDNRDLSFDSRAPEYEPVRLSDVVGRYRWTYWHTSSVAKQN
jgi:signal peptidase I